MKNTVYQLNSVTNVQMNSYIITTSDGHVMIIDGGFRQDAENMLTYLRDSPPRGRLVFEPRTPRPHLLLQRNGGKALG